MITSNTSPHFVFDFDAVCQNTLHIAGRSLWELTVSELGKSYGNGERKRWRDTWAPSPVASGFSRAGYQGELEDFISAIRAGKTECRTHFGTLHETYRCLELIEAACNRRNQLVSEMAS